MSHESIQPDLLLPMNTLGSFLAKRLRPYGFCLLVFPLNDRNGRMNYIANANREDMLIAMKEFIANAEGRGPDGLPVSRTPQ